MATASDPSLEARLGDALEERADALVARDESSLRALLHPLFAYTNASGSVLDLEGYLDLTVRGPLYWRDQRFAIGRLVRIGATVAMTALVDDRVVVDGVEHAWQFATTQVYVEDAGRLVYLAGHTGPLA